MRRRNGKTLTEIAVAYNTTTNPVTRSVYRDMLMTRLDQYAETDIDSAERKEFLELISKVK